MLVILYIIIIIIKVKMLSFWLNVIKDYCQLLQVGELIFNKYLQSNKSTTMKWVQLIICHQKSK